MDPMTVKMASLRLAPLQVGSWGHPETTGLPTMDYYLSAELLEPDNPEEYYSERLVKLPNLGCYYKKSTAIAESIDLNGLGIAVDQPLLICPGAPFKYQPQYDDVFVNIAKQLEKCQLIFFTHQRYQLTELLKNRIASRFLEAGLNFKDYCIFIPWQPKNTFYSLMKRADAFLDTIGFSGFNTAMQAIECDLPIVTREGKFMRGRLAGGILKRIGLSELIAHDERDYVNLVIKLVRDPEYNQSIRQHIKDNCDALYEDLEPVRALEKFIESTYIELIK
jgi:predicted O-linked N-acetylglucosamine transferase (SPINDLY family)